MALQSLILARWATMHRCSPAVLLALAGCVAAPPPPPADPTAPLFPALRFFEGRTEGRGRLRVALHALRTVQVHGNGRTEGDGTLVLDQLVERAGSPPMRRTWRIREVAPGRYAGTLSDAIGPIAGQAEAGRLHLSFRMKGGLAAQQWLTLAADGASARNLMIVRARGIAVARLDETIRRVDPLPPPPAKPS